MASVSTPPSWFDSRCHNPACAVEDMPLKRCGSCQVARYCTPMCQAKDWRRHRGGECRGYKERHPHLRLVAPARSIMARQEPFEADTMGVLTSCAPSEALVTDAPPECLSQWCFTRLSRPDIVDFFRQNSAAMQSRRQWVLWCQSHEKELHDLWNSVYDPEGYGVVRGGILTQDGAIRALGVSLSVRQMRRVVVQASLLDVALFVGGGPTRATRRAARSRGDVLTGCETQRLRVMDPNERYETALSRTITFISLAMPF